MQAACISDMVDRGRLPSLGDRFWETAQRSCRSAKPRPPSGASPQEPGLIAALFASGFPAASSARTATDAWAGTVIEVSNPLRGAEPTTAPPAPSTCQLASAVAPFQLALTVVWPPSVLAASFGGAAGVPVHGVRYAR